ncbi:MurR/RpiR family transcriptional regulator [Lacticaseibacillus manihotivorans]|uniref:MurR/RpiR family transcriptional regulator n=1 Tax=Lacticaseibacillus manihotivorans TaxID=88233 RepID=UPI0006CFAEE2|nr:MurR/RpiR family transcriptional regulator [Lacticaseibacillus manihotivorans]
MSVEGNIMSIQNSLTAAEKRLADYLLAEPQQVLGMSVKALAEATDTSPASVSRFCRRLRFPGYNELKIQLSSDLNDPSTAIAVNPEVVAGETVMEIQARLLQNAERSLHETVDQMDQSVIDQLCQALKTTSQLVCFGLSASYLVAQNIAQKWSRLGLNCIATDDVNQLLPLAVGDGAKNKVYWIISNSGESPEAVIGARMANDAGGLVVTMTTLGPNSLVTYADIPLVTSMPIEGNIRFAATQSLHAQFMLVDVIYYRYAALHFDETKQAITASRRAVNFYKKSIYGRYARSSQIAVLMHSTD